jgi:ribA/ribD-fused uncharacterized protein
MERKMTSSIMKQHASLKETILDLQTLKEHVSYHKQDSAWFFSKEDQNWELSNMAGGMALKFDGITWNSSEQLYQASKYFRATDCLPASSLKGKGAISNVRQRILSQTNARGAKMTQKCAVKAGLVRQDWDDPQYEIRIHSMLWVLELKQYFNPFTFGKILKETGDKPIVEVSKKDSFWGCKEIGNGMLEGQNVLGKLLEIIRSRKNETMSRNFVYPDGFLLD